MVEERGVPVFVNPSLMQDEEADDDLEKNAIRVGWDDGINLLQMEGVPVFVQPKLMKNEYELADLDESINRIGWDNDLKLLQTDYQKDVDD